MDKNELTGPQIMEIILGNELKEEGLSFFLIFMLCIMPCRSFILHEANSEQSIYRDWEKDKYLSCSLFCFMEAFLGGWGGGVSSNLKILQHASHIFILTM